MRTGGRWTVIFFGLALLVYLPGIWWGLPEATAPGRHAPWGTDELGPVGAINELYGVFAARNPTFNPQYPVFHYLCQVVLVAPFYVGLYLTGHLSYPDPNFPYGLDHPPFELGVMTILARLVSALMAAGVVAAAFRTGEILRNRGTGILSAVLVLLLYPMLYYARTSNVDMGALFWTALGLLAFARCLKDGLTARRGVALGICAALATASKDASYAAFLPAGAVVLVRHLRTMRGSDRSWIDALREPVRALTVSAAVYLVASGFVFRPSRYLRHLEFITQGSTPSGLFYFRHQATLGGYLDLGRELAQQLADAMGLPMLACAAAGLVLWAARDRLLLLWTLPAAGIIAGVILPVRFVLLRFVLIVVYVLAFSAADFLHRGLAQSRGVLRAAAMAAAVGVVAWSGIRGADLTVQMLRDARYAATDWLAAAARPGDRVGHIVPAHTLPRIPDQVRTRILRRQDMLTLSAATGPDFVVSIPMHDFEPVHEESLPEEIYQRLLDGSLGYRQAALIHSPSLFRRRPVTFVNPPVRIFIREDLWLTRIVTRGPS